MDAHVHLFPDFLFIPIWQWFRKFGWPIRYQLSSKDIINFLLSRGIGHLVALHYAHKPGVARSLNAYMADICRSYPQVTAMATVLPGEKDAAAILEDAFRDGLGGVKLHNHVQCFAINGDAMHEIYKACCDHSKPLIMYGTDFPNLPYAWDREIKQIVKQSLPDSVLERILGLNAVEFYNISPVMR